MKDILVEITENGAIIHKDPAIIFQKKGLPNCILNPDLANVRGVSPTYWQLVGGKIVEVGKQEKKNRNEAHEFMVITPPTLEDAKIMKGNIIKLQKQTKLLQIQIIGILILDVIVSIILRK